MKKNFKVIFGFITIFLVTALTLFAQTNPPIKKNERPENTIDPTEKTTKIPLKNNATAKQEKFPFRYEFSQPNFVVSHIIIEHDANGKGKIIFEKSESEGSITDPIQLTPVSLEKIQNLLKTLNFLDSTENYQSPIRDYGHLGNQTITITQDIKTRTAKYNWTENLDARALAAEYRKIAEQYIWIFDMSVSLENQPLEAPSLMDRLESLLQRDEISDPPQLIPRLKELSNDERIPLLARNHALRIIKSIEKKKEK